MAEDSGRLVEEVVQGVLLDDPGFLKEIVERANRELLEAEMTEHIGAAPYASGARGPTGHRNGHKRRTLRTRVGTTLNLLVPQDREGGSSLPSSFPVTSATRRRWSWR